MADDPARQPPRARPVADSSLERLEARAEDLARRWAAELVLARPLAALGRISLEEVTRQAPELCLQVLRAVASDAELARLLDPDAPERGAPYADRAAALSGAREAGAAVAAVESLRGVLWEELLAALGAGGADRSRERVLGDASDRLAYVCASLAAAAVDRERPAAAARPARFPERPPGPRVAPESRTVIVDDRGSAGATAEGEGGEEQPPGRLREEQLPGRLREEHPPSSLREEQPPVRVAGARGPLEGRVLAAPPAQIAIRDARSEEGPAAWIRSIGEQLERFEHDGMPFAVVLMDVAALPPGTAQPVEGEIEGALAADLRESGGGSLTRERHGRYWLLVPRVDRIGAHSLADRMQRTVAALAAREGIGITVATGTAVCPEDGEQAATLAAHADVALYAARWESRSGGAGGEPGEER
ncbi:MAG TPA: hypothetical protein VF927_05940 [Solirubrobacteraceae bacterium]